MKKLERQRLNAQRLKRENIEAAKNAAEKIGQGFVDYELPPDEVDEKMVERSLKTSLLSLVPYTDEWYESKAAEEEMDNLRKIRVEQVKANDLYVKSKMGKHEEALETMMSETNYDFFYFNKLKLKMEQEGKFKFEMPTRKDPFGEGGVKNRIRRAANFVANAFDAETTAELSKMAALNHDKLKPNNFDEDPPMSWQSRSKHAKLKPSRESASREAETSVSLRKNKTNNNAPDRGILCTWIPSPKDSRMRGFECCNEMMFDPNTGKRLPFCPWHVTECVRLHPPNSNSAVLVPNQYGLCRMHYLAEHGENPPVTKFPFPGMKKKLGKDFWKHMKKRHFGVPRYPPPPVIKSRAYVEPNIPENVIDQVLDWVKYIKFLVKRRQEGLKSAIKIQSMFRMYRVRNCHLTLRDKRHRKLRNEAAIVIQTQMRRFLGSKYMRECRIRYNRAATNIQKIFRGFNCRRKLKIDWAARRIARFMKLLHFFKFKDAVIMIMQLRRFFRKRNLLAIEIQRVFRGFSARLFVFRTRLWRIVVRSYAKKIQRFWRAYVERRSRRVAIVPSEEWARAQCAKKLANMILELYLDAQRRRELHQKMLIAGPQVQRLVRGFLARRGRKKLGFLRNALQSWFKPFYATDFLSDFLKNKVVDEVCEKYLQRLRPPLAITQRTTEDMMYVRQFLPKRLRGAFEVDFRVFGTALAKWYESIHLPLVESEKELIMRTFKNPMNGNIFTRSLDEYIHHHQQPCRKHARRICGSCFYRQRCMIRNCKCNEYEKNHSHKGGICSRCDHPKSLHAIMPLQFKFPVAYAGQNKLPLLDLLAFHSEADMSIPVNVKGSAIENVLIRELDEDDKRQIRRDVMLANRKTKAALTKQTLFEESRSIIANTSKSGSIGRIATQDERRMLARKLARLEMGGDTISDNSVYWDQFNMSTVDPTLTSQADTAKLADESIFEPVTFNEKAPDTDISFEKFWKIAAKNPNKKVEDYHESFNHNMPVPVLHHGELVYTFDGSQVYFNIINQIVAMEEKDIHYDHPILLKLVMDHIQIFERHWRKMVVDIRTGKLNEHLLISPESRMAFESSNVPRPLHSQRLDNVFRQLGFHKKVLGKDIEIKDYAPKKTQQEILDAIAKNTKATEDQLQTIVDTNWKNELEQRQRAQRVSLSPPRSRESRAGPPQVSLSDESSLKELKNKFPLLDDSFCIPVGGLKPNPFVLTGKEVKRKRSLPFEPSEAGILSISRPASSVAEDIFATTATRSSMKTPKTAELATVRVPIRSPKLSHRSSMDPEKTFSSPRRVDTSHKGKRELLQALGRTFHQNKEVLQQELDNSNQGHFSATIVDQLSLKENEHGPASASRTGTAKRRKSQSESQRPFTTEELNQINYELVTAPRDKRAYGEPLKLNEDRYVCPFPACGCSFYSKDAAMRHIPTHEQRTRVYSATPMSDSHLKYYWPENVPWLTAKTFTVKKLPPGSVRCTVPNCPEIFATNAKLEAHMRLVHQNIHPSSTILGYVKCEKNYRTLPPDTPPQDFYLKYCHFHATPLSRCVVCMEIETSKGPKSPLYLMESLAIDFRAKHEALSIPLSEAELKNIKKNSVDHNSTTIRIFQRDHRYLLWIRSDGTSNEFKARAIFLLVDRLKMIWVGVEPLYSMDDIICNNMPLPTENSSSHNKYELFPARTINGIAATSISGEYKKLSEDSVMWIPVHMIKRVSPLMYIKNDQFVRSLAGNPNDNLVESVAQVPIGTHFTVTEP